uniref:AlNc14C238G9438 protein n=1 Tax=Albugo laibachii Nc14 TaxID=890382 RepID=F0WSU2_9STRA|nr:AlNc14C238G9438 [Albugo laibachii Nc14]|eukprot:CCA24420.1 AlNc14C238G9438 [Albugo laibachii Nc14]
MQYKLYFSTMCNKDVEYTSLHRGSCTSSKVDGEDRSLCMEMEGMNSMGDPFPTLGCSPLKSINNVEKFQKICQATPSTLERLLHAFTKAIKSWFG